MCAGLGLGALKNLERALGARGFVSFVSLRVDSTTRSLFIPLVNDFKRLFSCHIHKECMVSASSGEKV
jgi:hypothetical protein